MTDIRCVSCCHMAVTGRSAVTSNNWHLAVPRGVCYCKHEDAKDALNLVCPDSKNSPTFIAFMEGGTNVLAIKTAPRWCPKKLLVRPTEVSNEVARTVFATRKPRGLFFLKEGEGYTGIDNSTGDAWTEEFPDKGSCLRWLIGKE